MTTTALALAAIEAHCRALRLPTIAGQCERLAEEAVRTQQSPLSYLAELLGAEVDDREQRTLARRLQEARLPRLKTLEEFDFSANPALAATQLQPLAARLSTVLCKRSVTLLSWHAFFEFDGETIQCQFPIFHRYGPFLGGPLDGQINDFHGGAVRGKNPPVFRCLTDNAVQRFNGVGGIDHPSNLLRIIK